MSEMTLLRTVRKNIEDCADLMGLDAATRSILVEPGRELHVALPVRMDNGKIQVFKGCRVQHNNARGPAKGGVRFHPDEDFDSIRGLASIMTWKCSLLDLPLGGAKGGVVCNPKAMSAAELERLSRAYIEGVHLIIGPDKDVLAPDVYTNPQIMAWMMDEYSKMEGKNQFGVVTGKPLGLWGAPGRYDATSRGGVYALKVAAEELGLDLSRARVAIQGFGNAGSNAALLARKVLGSKVVAVSDSKGGIYNPAGLDVEKAVKHKKDTGSVVGFPGAEAISNDDVLLLDAEVLVPAALEGVLTAENAGQVKARIVAELANGPTTPEADQTLEANGVHVIPDFLCNSGGVTVSQFEMVQDAYMHFWEEDEVHRLLEKKMVAAYRSVLEMAKKRKISLRKAAYFIAVDRVVEAMRHRGWI